MFRPTSRINTSVIPFDRHFTHHVYFLLSTPLGRVQVQRKNLEAGRGETSNINVSASPLEKNISEDLTQKIEHDRESPFLLHSGSGRRKILALVSSRVATINAVENNHTVVGSFVWGDRDDVRLSAPIFISDVLDIIEILALARDHWSRRTVFR